MPSQHPFSHAPRSRKRQNAFVVPHAIDGGNLLVLLVAIITTSVDHFEKVCWWKLFVIPNHNHLFCSRDRSQGILRCNLARFVYNEHVKGQFGREGGTGRRTAGS